MDIVLKAELLSSGNKQVRFQIEEGEYKGMYGYLLAPTGLKYEKICQIIKDYIHSSNFNFYPFSNVRYRHCDRPVFINTFELCHT